MPVQGFLGPCVRMHRWNAPTTGQGPWLGRLAAGLCLKNGYCPFGGGRDVLGGKKISTMPPLGLLAQVVASSTAEV